MFAQASCLPEKKKKALTQLHHLQSLGEITNGSNPGKHNARLQKVKQLNMKSSISHQSLWRLNDQSSVHIHLTALPQTPHSALPLKSSRRHAVLIYKSNIALSKSLQNWNWALTCSYRRWHHTVCIYQSENHGNEVRLVNMIQLLGDEFKKHLQCNTCIVVHGNSELRCKYVQFIITFEGWPM